MRVGLAVERERQLARPTEPDPSDLQQGQKGLLSPFRT